jgi:hypothetical protein
VPARARPTHRVRRPGRSFGPHAGTWHGGRVRAPCAHRARWSGVWAPCRYLARWAAGSPHPAMGCGQPDPPIPVMGYPPGWGPRTGPEGCGAGAAESRRVAGRGSRRARSGEREPGTAGSGGGTPEPGGGVPGPEKWPRSRGTTVPDARMGPNPQPPCQVPAWGPKGDHSPSPEVVDPAAHTPPAAGGYFSWMYSPGASAMGGCLSLPMGGGLRRWPPWALAQVTQSSHQEPACSVAPASHT